jgi:hypothetical protein
MAARSALRLAHGERGTSVARVRLPTSKPFLQAFPNFGLFSPSFSKLFQSFLWWFCGISMGYSSRKTNKVPFPNFWSSPLARRAGRAPPNPSGSLKGHEKHVSTHLDFRKRNPRRVVGQFNIYADLRC